MSETSNSQKQEEEKISEKEFYEEMLYSIDKARPPSIWKERFFFMLIGILGGIGLGFALMILYVK